MTSPVLATASIVSKAIMLLAVVASSAAHADDRPRPTDSRQAKPIEHPMFLAMRKSIEDQRRALSDPKAAPGQGTRVVPRGDARECARRDGECPVSS